MAVEIDSKVTPSLHPHNVEAIDGYDNETAPAVAQALEAFQSAYVGVTDTYRARAAAERDLTLTDAARLLKVGDFAERHQNAVTGLFDKAHANLTRAIAALDSSLNEPLKLRAERPGVAQEVRAHVKALSSAKREAWFSERQRAGDLESLEIVLGAPGYLSGLSDDERAVRTRFYHEMRQPLIGRRLKVMRAALEMIHTQAPQIMAAVAAGALDPDTGRMLLDCISTLRGITQVDELEARIRELEERFTA